MKIVLTLIVLLFLTIFVVSRSSAQGTKTADKPSVVITTVDSLSSNILSYAQTLIGIPYRAASSNPLHGFDCSGFVNFVFKKFDIKVPRSSQDFANAGEKVSLADAKPGDVILFTGTATHHPHSVGHVGIVFSNQNGILKFIHSTSGKEYGVTISAMEDTYKRRFVEVVRMMKQAVL